uniref:Uncharacterized protein MANES_08G115900 n=1 Tax=Rhizophora mucronata TaxID=61149 RepID=A0A2P2JN99_RHIMU
MMLDGIPCSDREELAEQVGQRSSIHHLPSQSLPWQSP